MNRYFKYLVIIVIGIIIGACMHKCRAPQSNVSGSMDSVTDTIKVYDTIHYIMPNPQSELALGSHPYTLPTYLFHSGGAGGESRQGGDKGGTCTEKQDSIIVPVYGTGTGGEPRCSGDSAIVELPIIQRHYADSTYEAWVSGPIDPRLDSINIFTQQKFITKREWKPPKHWHVGITAGVGYGYKGFQPYIGVGITYSIFSF